MLDGQSESEWTPPLAPRDGKPRMHRIYGYRFTGNPRFPLGDSLGQHGIGTTNPDEADALRAKAASERPDDRWVVEWVLL
jgi:hypothetical protein